MSHLTMHGCIGPMYHGWVGPPYSGCCGSLVSFYPVPMPYPVLPGSGYPGGAASSPVTVALEASVDSTATSQKVLIGGTTAVCLTLEYLPDEAATAASVKVTIVSEGSTTSTWEESTIAPGYHVKSDFPAVAPGTKVTLEIIQASARLRWCETLCC